jgi:hypothetical protein
MTPANEALMVTAAVMLNAVELEPAGTVTLAGTVVLVGLFLDRLTMMSPVGAGDEGFTVPREFEPPVTIEGFSVSDESATDCVKHWAG